MGAKSFDESYDWLNAQKNPSIPNSYCGYSDWRLPSYAELYSLIKYGPYTPGSWLNNHGFNNIQDNSYWTSTIDTANPANASYIDFSNGDDNGTTVQTTSLYVLPVRGQM